MQPPSGLWLPLITPFRDDRLDEAALHRLVRHYRQQPSTAGDQPNALAAWRNLADLPRLLFAEPSPAPIKRWLWRIGLIDSPEVRLPMMSVSDVLAARIDGVIAAQRSTGQ
jgi:dihydrodipicolinate synthase/N-acetylneuraminate lyase